MTRNVIDAGALSDLAELSCDVVVVGSGAGGAPIATELAEEGLDVVILEEGPLVDTEGYSGDFSDRIGRLMRDGGGSAIVGRSPVQYFEGRCVGGSTVVNGGMCWRTPDKVLHRWAVERRLPELTPRALEPLFERVERRIQARLQDTGTNGGNNDVFKRGCDRMGYKTVENVRNQVHCVGTNECVVGCPSGAKQSTLQSYLPSFWRAGGRLVTGARVTRILTESGRASGVQAEVERLEGRRTKAALTVRAPIVVLAAGATQTPLLLLRNKLANRSRQVGRNFTIHPNIKVAALFDDPVVSQRGVHQAFQCNEFHEEGILFAPGGVPPIVLSLVFHGFGAAHAAQMRAYDCLATGGVLVDDYASGRVRLGPFGVPVLQYDVTDVDQAKFIRGAALLAEVYFAAGARKVFLPFHGVPPLESPDELSRLFSHPPRVVDTEYFTAHIMGTCRMHGEASEGVVAPSGETHDVPNLFIADASVLPGTLGVNPQETIMTLSTRTAFHILEHRMAYIGKRVA